MAGAVHPSLNESSVGSKVAQGQVFADGQIIIADGFNHVGWPLALRILVFKVLLGEHVFELILGGLVEGGVPGEGGEAGGGALIIGSFKDALGGQEGLSGCFG